jgi:prolyl oligopeptidase
VIELLKKGVKKNIRAFEKSIEHVMAQVETFTKHTPEKSPLYQPISRMGDGFSESERNEISKMVRDAISESVIPAYKRIYEYLKEDYIYQSRKQEGIWSLPDGIDLYQFFVRYHTTTNLSPEEIHEIGIREVGLIKDKIQKIMGRIGFNGSIRDFAVYLKGKKDLYPNTRQEILDEYWEILSHMDKKLPEYFGKLPKAGYAVKEIEHYREKTAPAAYYYPPPRDFSRPGYFYANTYKPEQRPKYDMEALSYHEAVPGHHLQIAIMQELEHIPDFRRHGGSTAFIEGWALYTEKLAKEMGFYRDDYAEYGRLSFGLWRAVRLVVDTGLHFFRWNRERAIQYCKKNTGLEEHEIAVEVDRYIAIPGQALSYKIGELKILGLREKAQNVLGSLFDIRQFHDRLLEHGALPLDILEETMLSWIEKAVSGNLHPDKTP